MGCCILHSFHFHFHTSNRDLLKTLYCLNDRKLEQFAMNKLVEMAYRKLMVMQNSMWFSTAFVTKLS